MSKLPKTWSCSSLSDVSDRIWIGLVTTMTKHYVAKGVPLIRNSDIKEGYIKKTGLINLSESFADENSSRAFKTGDIATVHTGDCGTSAVICKNMSGAIGFATLNTRVNDAIVDRNYLCCYMNSDLAKDKIFKVITGDGRNNLNMGDFVHLKVEYPKLINEQKKIAEAIASINKVIELTKIEIEKLKNLKKGMLQDLLKKGIGHTKFKDSPIGKIPESWEYQSLLDAVQIQNGQVDPTLDSYKDMILIAPNHVESENGRLIYKETASEQSAISGKFLCRPETIIYSKIRPKLKKAVYVDFECLCSADMYPFVPNEEVDPKFLLYILLSEKFSDFAASVSERSNIPKINRKELSEFKLALPSLKEQKEISRVINCIVDQMKLKYFKLRKIQDMKKGLMHDLLTGKVRVKV